ncbi:hypothetical protein [Arenimonas terrae]|uniref:hypothetical protein n=1 Tax=Arenimonas terrae TaxID=2546226 RepID=UPI00159EBBB1
MKSDNISRVEIDSSGRLCVWPAATDFAYIYRAAMEVHWDEQGQFLYSPPPRAWSYTDWFAQIVAATKDEYGCDLRITSQTTWVNIDPALKELICALGTHPRA